MARSSKLRLMLSSKCEVGFPPASGRQLSDIRRDLKADIEKMEIAGKKAFEVWINEEAPPSGGTWDSWDVCMEAVKACDILIVVSNGDAGWAGNAGEVGICHAEMMTGLSLAPAKVRLIALPNVAITEDAAGIRNSRFQRELNTQSLFRGGTVETEKALKSRVFEALHDAVVALAQAGVGDAAKGKYSSGAALDWTRLDFSARRDQMVAIVRHALLGRPGSDLRTLGVPTCRARALFDKAAGPRRGVRGGTRDHPRAGHVDVAGHLARSRVPGERGTPRLLLRIRHRVYVGVRPRVRTARISGEVERGARLAW